MAGLGNTLTTWIGSDPTPVVTTRATGESDDDFIDRHCRAVYARLAGSGANVLKSTELGITLERETGQSDQAFAGSYCSALKAAA